MSFFFSSRRRHTRYWRDWSSDVCSSDLACVGMAARRHHVDERFVRVAPLEKRLEVDLLQEAGVQRCVNAADDRREVRDEQDRKSTRLNSSHANISYAVFCLKKKTKH